MLTNSNEKNTLVEAAAIELILLFRYDDQSLLAVRITVIPPKIPFF